MMISLHRSASPEVLEYRSILDREGLLVTRLTTYREGGMRAGGAEEPLGRVGARSTDRLARTLVRRALASGYHVLYAYVPEPSLPLTRAYLSRESGVDVVPDSTDGVPVWLSDERARGATPSYLLFTVLSSEAK